MNYKYKNKSVETNLQKVVQKESKHSIIAQQKMIQSYLEDFKEATNTNFSQISYFFGTN